MSTRPPFVHEWFAETARRYPAAIAMETNGSQMTYGAIDHAAWCLARRLAAAGVVAGDPVVIFSTDRVQFVVAMLACLRAGCAFVPTTPDLPQRRLEAILEHVAPRCVVVAPTLIDRMTIALENAAVAARVLTSSGVIPDEVSSLADVERPVVDWDPDGFCYLYFTSGSTGAPKGIAGRLKAIDHFLRWEIDTFGIAPGTRVSQLIAPMADAFLHDVFAPLCAGGTSCVPDSEDLPLDGAGLIAWLDAQRINLVHCGPSVLRAMLAHLRDDQLGALRWVLLSGEPLRPADVKRWYEVVGDRVRLVSLYGASETTMTKFVYVTGPADAGRRSIPVGKPIEGARALVFDDDGRVCPKGIVGEIYIRTPFRSLGYYKQPELTSDVFVPNPLTRDAGDLVYRTGDLSRVLEDGNFELVGRRDRQVEVNGAGLSSPETIDVPLVARARPPVIPLSFAQQRLWFVEQLAPASAAYNMRFAVRLSGPLDVAAIVASVRAIVGRHEVLRTSFPIVDGAPVQAIAAEMAVDVQLVDVSRLRLADAEALRIVEREARRPFDLDHGPLLRATLLRRAPDAHVLLFTLHHIVGDAWSIGVLVREFAALYAARGQRAVARLPALPVQYADYTLWQRGWLQGDVLRTQSAYWREQVDGASPLTLPLDYPRPSAATGDGAYVQFSVAAPVSDALNALGRAAGVTTFMVLLSVVDALLHRYTGASVFLVGTPIAGRSRAEVEPLIGFFVNTLVLRAEVHGSQSARDLLARVRDTCLDAHAHQEFPFELLVADVHPIRSVDATPLFQVMFDHDAIGMPRLGLPGLDATPITPQRSVAKFDLVISTRQTRSGLSGQIEFRTDLFARPTIERMAAHFSTLLAAIVEQPDAAIATLPLLSATERHLLVNEWSQVPQAPVATASLPALFERQVRLTPDAAAVMGEDDTVTYSGLNRWANQLAHWLIARGIGPESVVALALPRSAMAVGALLAVSKTGAAYVPLGPGDPPERVAHILADTRSALVLATRAFRPQMNGGAAAAELDTRDMQQALARAASHDPTDADRTARLDARNTAYIIYTSGSTGRPRGVAVPHVGLAALARTKIDGLDSTVGSRVLQFAPATFDASVAELLGTLTAGATLVTVPEHARIGEAVAAAMIRHQVTQAILPPVVLATLESADALPLRSLIVAGDTCSAELARRWTTRVRVRNAYGPTETTVCATMTDVLADGAPPPIGRPIRGTTVYVLDDRLEPVPVGVAGEIHVAGPALARGYVGQPGLTAEKFVPDPHGPPGTRMYRTGDRGRWLADGQVSFIGRRDFQMKIRGIRVEAGEIEAVVQRCPGVRDAVVVAREDQPGRKRLVAFVVADGPCDPQAVRHATRETLPEHLVPSEVVLVAEFPRTSSGKANRAALESMALPRPEAASGAPPASQSERLVTAIWRDVLNRPDIDIDSNFFDLGGDSIALTRVHAMLRRSSDVAIGLVDLFRYTTIRALAKFLDAMASPAPRIDTPATSDALRAGGHRLRRVPRAAVVRDVVPS